MPSFQCCGVPQRPAAVLATIRERFGVKSALDYLVGEKLLSFANAADRDPEFAAELPRFQAAVWEKLYKWSAETYWQPSLYTTS